MRYTQKRNGKNVIPLLNAVCGLDMPYWRVDKADDLHSYLSGDAADKLAAYEDAEEQGRLVILRWIPVTEEPPLKVGDDGYNGYLVYADGYYEVADYTTDKFDCVPYFHVDGEYEPGVTHWMQLPQPPTEQMVTDSNQVQEE